MRRKKKAVIITLLSPIRWQFYQDPLFFETSVSKAWATASFNHLRFPKQWHQSDSSSESVWVFCWAGLWIISSSVKLSGMWPKYSDLKFFWWPAVWEMHSSEIQPQNRPCLLAVYKKDLWFWQMPLRLHNSKSRQMYTFVRYYYQRLFILMKVQMSNIGTYVPIKAPSTIMRLITTKEQSQGIQMSLHLAFLWSTESHCTNSTFPSVLPNLSLFPLQNFGVSLLVSAEYSFLLFAKIQH